MRTGTDQGSREKYKHGLVDFMMMNFQSIQAGLRKLQGGLYPVVYKPSVPTIRLLPFQLR